MEFRCSSGKLCSSDKKLISYWQSNLNESIAQTLAPEGAYQQEEISSKFLNLFPEILPDTFATEDYKVSPARPSAGPPVPSGDQRLPCDCSDPASRSFALP